MSGLLAGAIVAAAFDISNAAVTTQTSPWTTLTDNLGEGLVPTLIGFALSAICALLGYWVYHRNSSRREMPVESSMT